MKLLYIFNIVLLLLISFIRCSDLDTSICEYDDFDQETSYDINTIVNIQCENGECNINGEGANFSNDVIEINKQGTYVIKGSLDGQLIVEADEEAIVHIIFDNAKINSSIGTPLYIAEANKVLLTLVNDNILTSSLTEAIDNTVILSNCNLSINGTGSLKLETSFGELIYCNEDLKLVTGEIVISTSDIKKIIAKNSICIKDTTFNILKDTSTKTISSVHSTSLKTTSTEVRTTTKGITTKPSKGTTTRARTTTTRRDTAPTNAECSALIQKLGYKCCGAGCKIIYVDKYGNWGEKNDKWCACGGGAKCSPLIINKGYRCCQADNCSIKYSDKDGDWGVDQKKKAWCGIRYSCSDKQRKS